VFSATDWSVARSVAVDSSGNVYTTGHFGGTVDFDPGAGTTNLTSNGHEDVFVSKLDSSGDLVWAKSFGGTGRDRGWAVAVDSSGNVYTAGFFIARSTSTRVREPPNSPRLAVPTRSFRSWTRRATSLRLAAVRD